LVRRRHLDEFRLLLGQAALGCPVVAVRVVRDVCHLLLLLLIFHTLDAFLLEEIAIAEEVAASTDVQGLAKRARSVTDVIWAQEIQIRREVLLGLRLFYGLLLVRELHQVVCD